MKKALITGVAGQDGSYLAEYLLSLGYQVFGLARRESGDLPRLRAIRGRIEVLYGDMRDEASLNAAFQQASPDEVYNLAGQAFVPASWEVPAETFEVNVGGLARLLKIIEKHKPFTRIFQASSSGMFGNADGLCNEDTPLNPTSPYGTSKMFAHRLIEVYRARGLYAVSGILFSHESPRRTPQMVTRKITLAAAAWASGDKTKLRLGNLQARRDWGFAGDYVKVMHAMLQQQTPKDYVIGTGESHSVAEFVAEAFAVVQGGRGEARLDALADFVEVDPRLVRHGEAIASLRADAGRARRQLGWRPEVDFPGLVKMMVEADLAAAMSSTNAT
jgi:GDPmannose 4,6-dehydratase